jgi:hypothetical protein
MNSKGSATLTSHRHGHNLEDLKMKFILTAFVAGFIGSTTLALADTPVSPAEARRSRRP